METDMGTEIGLEMTGDMGTILIVDDSPANLMLLESILQDHGYNVRAAISGELALKNIHRQAPDMILLDVNMPGMNGYEVCRTLKAEAALAEIPVIFVSAATDTADKLRAFEEGGVDYVTKPFQAQEVLARVETHLTLARARKELEQKNSALEKAMHDLKQAQAQLVQSEKMAALGMLTAGIAHELNNPLNFIAASVQALKKIVTPFEELIRLCEQSHENCTHFKSWCDEHDHIELCATLIELVDNSCYGSNRAADIVRGLRIFTRLDESELKSTDLHENLDAVLLLLHNRYMKRIKIIKNYGELPTWVCQPGKLNQAFMNLVSNAVDAINAKPELTTDEKITLTTRLEERDGGFFAVVEIADTGTGMSDAVKERLFQPFFTTKDVGEGVGLGLAITHGIVRDHDGVIEVETTPGKGSMFRVIIPQERSGERKIQP
jgi:signal transduction histidine kinase